MNTQTTNNSDLLINEAECNERSNRLSEAIELYERAIAKNTDKFDAYYNLGAIYERLQENKKAKDVYIKGITTARMLQNKSIETELSFTLLGLMD